MTGGDWLGLGSLSPTPDASAPAPSGGDWLGIGADPVIQGALAQPTDPLSQTRRLTAKMLTTAGKMLQPFNAAQQVLFGGIGGIEDLATGQGAAKAWDTLTQGTRAGLSYLTYGGYQAAGLKAGDPRDTAIRGFDLFKKAGAPDWLAKWGGLGADFVVDVPLLGWVGDVAKAGKLGGGVQRVARTLDAAPNLAQSFRDPGALQSFAAGILKAPMSTQPIKDLVNAVPLGYRTQAAEGIGNLLEGARARRGGFDTTPVGASVAENFIAPTGRVMGLPPVDTTLLKVTGKPNGAGLPDRYIDVERNAQTVKANIQLRAYDAAKRVNAVAAQVPDALQGVWTTIANRLPDAGSPSEIAHWDGELQKLGQAVGPNFYADASSALKRGTMTDVYAAENLKNVGLMDPADYQAYLQGDKNHLRRMFSIFENPAQHLDRLRTRNAPASVRYDDLQLAGFMGVVQQANPNLQGSATQLASDLKALWANPNVKPVDAMSDFLQQKGFTPQDTVTLLQHIGGEWGRQAGIYYKADDASTAAYLRNWVNEGGPSSQGGSRLAAGSSEAPLTQRKPLEDYQMEALGEVQDYAKRLTEQAKIVGGLVKNRSIVQGYVDLMQKDGVILDELPGIASMQNTGGWRYINAQMAGQLGADELSGKWVPGIFHRRLVETTTVRDPSVLQGVMDWTSAMWMRSKLANPASIARNMASNFVMAERMGVSPLALTRGMADYVSLVRQANRGDGILDQSVRVNGTTMKDLMDHGEFLHAGLMQAQVVERLGTLERALSNGAGSPLQRTAQSVSDFFQAHAANPAMQGAKMLGDLLGLGTGPLTAKLSDWYGQVDTLFKGGLYMAKRRAGVGHETSARFADEALFNYENQPYIIDASRKMGLAGVPFASFQLMSAGRFLRNMYENPYSVARYYRTGQSLVADKGPDEQASLYYGAPDFIKDSLYVFAGRDGKGQAKYFNLASLLPESGVWDMSNSDNVTNFEPPLVQLWRTMWTGQGYQGRATYTGGGSFSDTAAVNPLEAARGALRAAWQFGAVPWAPGQPMTERLAKSIADSAVPASAIPDPKVQAALKLLVDGPVAAGFDRASVNTKRPGSSPAQSPLDAALRYIGITLYNVQPDYGEPGSARSNLMGGDAQLKLLQTMENSEMKSALTDAERAAIAARYEKLRAPIVQGQRDVVDHSK